MGAVAATAGTHPLDGYEETGILLDLFHTALSLVFAGGQRSHRRHRRGGQKDK
jgi:hypothetical protein